MLRFVALLLISLQTWVLQSLLVDKKRAFRCDDAHERLAALSAFPQNATVVYQRGRRRVLLTTARWQTVCVPISAFTGKARKSGVTRLWRGATGKVVKDRHDNP